MWKIAFKKFEGIWSAFLKADFHKFYLVHSWRLCPICSRPHDSNTALKGSKYEVFSWPVFSCIRTRKSSAIGHFSRRLIEKKEKFLLHIYKLHFVTILLATIASLSCGNELYHFLNAHLRIPCVVHSFETFVQWNNLMQ